MDRPDIKDLFTELFRGNQDRYGMEEGGSREIAGSWYSVVDSHLKGVEPFGVYPIDPDSGMCRWGCIDFDEGEDESLIHATNIRNFLKCHTITAWVERSRSKGYHVWVFAQEWIDPSIMRSALLYACQFMDAPTKEINPKQVSLEAEQVGNYVRLPYPGAVSCGFFDAERGNRRVMVDVESGFDIPFDLFCRDAWEKRTPVFKLTDLARWYKPTKQLKHNTYTASEVDDELIGRLTRLARKLFEEGGKYQDRSAALCYLAGQIARDGTHDESECKAILFDADVRWGKYSDRGDADQRLDEIVEKAFTDNESFY